ncbi:hypothetical protein EXIGLDRAFT_702340 [Exidia glandulosa HHB12029]|uniref:MYND-type domain-containing protein n=1 Tax=Exidia glandulosa HHB12029 TaxID=1314781 RepID=A0A165LJR7_EXIGL|nr:hypothetical protein EXIGLDRAFT_702340 [Exidia glandulosa HHB12029]
MDQVAQQMLLQLRDVHRPTLCLDCHVVAYAGIQMTGTATSRAKILQQRHQELLTVIMRFCTIPRSAQDLSILQRSLSSAMARCQNSNAHNSARFREKSTLAHYAFSMLTAPLDECLTRSDRLRRADRFSRTGEWPRSVDDLLPCSAQQSLMTLIFWVRHSPRQSRVDIGTAAQTVAFFRVVFRACRREFSEYMREEEVRRALTEMLCFLFDRSVEIFHRGSDVRTEATLYITSLGDLVHEVAMGSPTAVQPESPDSMQAIFLGSEDRVLGAFDAVWRCLDGDPLLRETKQRIGTILIKAYLAFGRAPPEYIDAMSGWSIIPEVYCYLSSAMCAIDVRLECSNPGCHKQARDCDVGKLQRCSSCKIFKYCTKACQAQHWSRPALPHKKHCRNIRNVLAVMPLEGVFSDDFLKTLVDYLVAEFGT